MSKIDLAYSMEADEIMEAIVAHELYFEGFLNDKTQFRCCGKNCTAQITCANMDKLFEETQRLVHFRCIGEHSPECEEDEKRGKEKNMKMKGRDKKELPIAKSILFALERPNNTSYNSKNFSNKPKDDLIRKRLPLRRSGGIENRVKNKNIFTLNSLVQIFLHQDEKEIIEVILEKEKCNKKRKRGLNELFKSIKAISFNNVNKDDIYVFYGMEKIALSKKGTYTIKFKEKFMENDKVVMCCIREQHIENCVVQRRTKETILKGNVDKIIKCYVMGKVNVANNIIFVNINNLDHMTITQN